MRIRTAGQFKRLGSLVYGEIRQPAEQTRLRARGSCVVKIFDTTERAALREGIAGNESAADQAKSRAIVDHRNSAQRHVRRAVPDFRPVSSSSSAFRQGRGWVIGRCTGKHVGRRQLHRKSRSALMQGDH
jgi:hypothetical protein